MSGCGRPNEKSIQNRPRWGRFFYFIQALFRSRVAKRSSRNFCITTLKVSLWNYPLI